MGILKWLFNLYLNLSAVLLTLVCLFTALISLLYGTSVTTPDRHEFLIVLLWMLSALLGLIAYWLHKFGYRNWRKLLPLMACGMVAVLPTAYFAAQFIQKGLGGDGSAYMILLLIFLPASLMFIKAGYILFRHIKDENRQED